MKSVRKLRRRLKRYTNFVVAIDMLRHRRISLVSPALWVDQNDKFLIEEFRIANHLKFVGAACLTESSETFHHWKIFADGMNGIFVEFDKERLEYLLRKQGQLKFGAVNYLRLDDVRICENEIKEELPFIKRAGFKDEREYRIMLFTKKEMEIFHVPIDIDCITRIVISPFLPDSLTDLVKDTLLKIDGCSRLNIVKSGIVNSATWRKTWNKRLAARAP